MHCIISSCFNEHLMHKTAVWCKNWLAVVRNEMFALTFYAAVRPAAQGLRRRQ